MFSALPDYTFFFRVHLAPERTVEILCKVFVVGEGPIGPEFRRGVMPGQDGLLQGFVLELGTPDLIINKM
jgi:hypothetical protein